VRSRKVLIQLIAATTVVQHPNPWMLRASSLHRTLSGHMHKARRLRCRDAVFCSYPSASAYMQSQAERSHGNALSLPIPSVAETTLVLLILVLA
jgi:hypothetical protein